MKARDAQKLRNRLMVIGFLVALGGYVWPVFTAIGIIVMFSCLIPDFLYNKCPHCKRRLGRNEGEFCHHCGGKIDE